MKEIWKSLVYKGQFLGDRYEISNCGRVRNARNKKVLKQNINKNGYCQIVISLGSRDNKLCLKVHKAVAETFIANPDNLPIPNHKDGDKINNVVDNLEWCTYVENTLHAFDMGLAQGKTKLDKETMEEIKNTYVKGSKDNNLRTLGKKYSVDSTTIWYIIHNK